MVMWRTVLSQRSHSELVNNVALKDLGNNECPNVINIERRNKTFVRSLARKSSFIRVRILNLIEPKNTIQLFTFCQWLQSYFWPLLITGAEPRGHETSGSFPRTLLICSYNT